MGSRQLRARIVTRDSVERMAKVVGEHSAAAKALREADAREYNCVFVAANCMLFVVPASALDPVRAVEDMVAPAPTNTKDQP